MDSRKLLRKQLDARLRAIKGVDQPRTGWIRTIRTALGMTMAQLGKRLGVSQPSVATLEAREARGTVSVNKLREAADALGCDLVIAFIPRVPLSEMVLRQAQAKARDEHDGLYHTMKLEAQNDGVDEPGDMDRAITRWTTTRSSRLWD